MGDSKEERRVLIDEWFPINEVSVESIRERSASSALPPLYFLHVWFARRPLATSRAAILASLLPNNFSKTYLFKLLGIPIDKDVVGAALSLARAKAQGIKTKNPFTWERAFKYKPNEEQLELIKAEAEKYWQTKNPIVLDPMAGGGSIPYEAIRLGLPTIAGDLNPVAFLCLKGTVEYPAKFGPKLIKAVEEFCLKVHREASKELEEFYPKGEGEEVYAYLWARTIRCITCGLTIPLSPNWWIVQEEGAEGIAARPIPPQTGEICTFEIIKAPKKHDFDPNDGTDVGKEAKCPRCRTITKGDIVKEEVQAGRMGHQLYIVCTKKRGAGRKMGWYFRTPTNEELEAIARAEEKLKMKLPEWEEKGLALTEEVPLGLKTRELINFGMSRWSSLFNPRQLLTHLNYLEKFLEAKNGLLQGRTRGTMEWKFAEAIATYGAMVFDTCVNYNCLLSRWDSTRNKVTNMMELQGFPFKSSYTEWNQLVPGGGFRWAVSKCLDSVIELVNLLPENPGSATIYCGDAASIPREEKSVDCIVVDPPYHENVMYGEVSDFVYVWLKRMLGDIFPDVFSTELTDKSEEAVANSAMFRDAERGMAKRLADQHYQSKMEACFKDMQRVLRDDGVMTVMFTHRKAEAWAGLAKALINAGFTFRASWPVFTEPGEKFGKQKKGVLKVTVLLACRKRGGEKKGLWEEIRRELYSEAERKVREHSQYGISGPDLLVSVYGPVLGKFADYSLVKDATGKMRTPEDALEVVAEVVNKFLTADLPLVDLDALGYLNLIRSFPYLEVETDLARLATVFGGNISVDVLDVKGGRGLLEKKEGKVRILLSKERVGRGIINPSKPETLRSLIDIVQASLVSYERLGIEPVKSLLKETGRDSSDSGFLAVVKAIAQIAINGNASKPLLDEAMVANALLEALGQQPEAFLKKGERLSHYL